MRVCHRVASLTHCWLWRSRLAGRVLAKRLRYGSEALANALPAKRLRQSQRWVQDATLWQMRIGQARDAWQAAVLLRELGGADNLVSFMQGVAAAMERAAQEAASPG